jgi:hypothetical protein
VRWPPSAPGGDPRRQLYFLHIAKTGGIALGSYLRSMYSAEEVCPAYHVDELLALDASTLSSYRYLAGHFSLLPLSLLAEPPAIVTVVREPVAHLRSLYLHTIRESGTGHPRQADTSFLEWLRHDDTRPLSVNPQARSLAGTLEEVGGDDDELYERAIATLDGCLWHSATEDLDSTIGSLAASMSWPAPNGVRRANVAPEQPAPPTDAEVELVATRGAVDMRIHRYVATRASRGRFGQASVLGRAVRRAGQTLEHTLVVELDHPFWGTGWLPPEAFWAHDDAAAALIGDRETRWLAADEPATLDLPVRLQPRDRVELVIVKAVPTSVPSLQLRVNQRPARKLADERRGDRIVSSFEVPQHRGRHSRLTFCSSPETRELERLDSPTREGRVVAAERILLIPDDRRP